MDADSEMEDDVEQYILHNFTNILSLEHIDCELLRERDIDQPKTFCNRSWDHLLCWPPTPPSTNVQLPCFGELNGIRYDTTKNATRWCDKTGRWNFSDYAACNILQFDDGEFGPGVEECSYLYLVGYSISLIAVSFAVWIFVYFKDLRCLRNTIHTNLMFTYFLSDFVWILTMFLHASVQTDMAACMILIVLLHYFHLTNFFWMLVEGLYLYTLVVITFTRDTIKLRAYVIIGWGTPLFFVTMWSIVRGLVSTSDVDMQAQKYPFLNHCPLMASNPYDMIYEAPALGVLAINLLFLVMIMWVLITKLRSANTVETQQYRKAAKALLVLIPLLGITYILLIAGPSEGVLGNIHAYVKAVLISTQGFTVALFYCFLNTEVQTTLRHHIARWKEARGLGAGDPKYTYSKDGSPNTRTESVRLCSTHKISIRKFRKRGESFASESTTMTLVGGLKDGTKTSNGTNITGDLV